MRFFIGIVLTLVLLAASFWLGVIVSRPDTAAPVTFPAPPASAISDDPVTARADVGRRSLFELQRAAIQRAGTLAETSGLVALLSDALQQDDHFYHSDLALVYLRRLVEIDPDRARQFVQGMGSTEHDGDLQLALAAAIAAHDPAGAMHYALQIPQEHIQVQVLSQLMLDRHIAAAGIIDEFRANIPPAAFARLDNLRNIQRDPAARFNEALQRDPPFRFAALHHALSEWVRTDADLAWQAVLDLPPGQERSQVLGEIPQSMIRLQVARTVIMGNPDRRESLAAVFSLTPAELAAIQAQPPRTMVPYMNSSGGFMSIAN